MRAVLVTRRFEKLNQSIDFPQMVTVQIHLRERLDRRVRKLISLPQQSQTQRRDGTTDPSLPDRVEIFHYFLRALAQFSPEIVEFWSCSQEQIQELNRRDFCI